MAQMRAAFVREHGGPEALEYGAIEGPEPGPGEILVRVAACALNRLDIFVRRGMPGVRLELPTCPAGTSWDGWRTAGTTSPAGRSAPRCCSTRSCDAA